MSTPVTIAIISILVVPLLIWLRKQLFIGPELFVEINRPRGRSIPCGISSKTKYENGVVDSDEAIRIFRLEWNFDVIVRNNSEHTAYLPELEVKSIPSSGKLNIDAPNKNLPIKANDYIILKAIYSEFEECIAKKRTPADSAPAILRTLKVTVTYRNSAKTPFYTSYDNATGDNKRHFFYYQAVKRLFMKMNSKTK